MRKLTMIVDIELPDASELTEREIVTAFDRSLMNIVDQEWRATLPADHIGWTQKYRTLPDETKIEMQRKRRQLRRETSVVKAGR